MKDVFPFHPEVSPKLQTFPFSRDLLCRHGSFSGKIYPPFRASKATIQVALFDVPLPLRYLDPD